MTMMRKSVLCVLLLLAITQLPLPGSAQNTFPRNGNESLALRLYDRYRESQVRLAQLEANRIKVKGFITEVAPASTMVGTAIAEEDVIALREIDRDIAKEQEWCRQLEVFWEKNRAVPPASTLSFAGRYGPLSNSGKPSSNRNYDMIENAIRTFPFNVSQSDSGANNQPTPTTGASLGSVWHQSENGWSGVWTRRGASNVFDGVWTKAGESLVVKGVLTITLTGAGNVTIRRQDTSQNAVVDYTGTIGPNGSVTGTGRIGGNSYTWSATIR